MSSCLGSVGVSPYADDEPAKTSRLTPASRAATSTFSVPSTLARLERDGILHRARHRRNRRLVQHVVDSRRRRAWRTRRSARSPSRNSDAVNVRQVCALAGTEVVGDADAMAAPHELFGQMRPDEPGAAGHEKVRHGEILTGPGPGSGIRYA